MTTTDANFQKKCSRCTLEKNYTDFYKDKNQSSGLRPERKECNRTISSQKQQKRKEYDKKRYYDNYEKMQEKIIQRRLKNNASEEELQLILEDIRKCKIKK